MYTNHQGLDEHPFYATFYHLGIDESKPLDQQFEEKIVSFETFCDVSDRNNSISNDTITMFFPFDSDNDKVKISIGETVEVNTYGLVQKGRVLGVYPSQLGGVTVLCTRI